MDWLLCRSLTNKNSHRRVVLFDRSVGIRGEHPLSVEHSAQKNWWPRSPPCVTCSLAARDEGYSQFSHDHCSAAALHQWTGRRRGFRLRILSS